MPHLFEPLTLRSITLPNRIAVSPMCEYSSIDGLANDWHLVHLGSRAVGGAGLVLTEAAAVSPQGRISPDDLGIWDNSHIEPLARIVRFVRSQGAYAGIQLAHAGRKASTLAPWKGQGRVELADGGWQPLAPSALAFAPDYHTPHAMTHDDIRRAIAHFVVAAERALLAGFDVVELHAAHGYLAHQFLSPLSNQRDDEYGGSFPNRVRFLLEMTAAVRGIWPDRLPLFVRISATDWAEGGWTLDESVELVRLLKKEGVDLIDCSSGGLVANASIAVGPGYQVPFAERIRRDAGIATGAVGMITTPTQADRIVRDAQADLVLLAREFLRDPYWPLHAAAELGVAAHWPPQYLRAAPRGSLPRRPREA
ncbi:MAG TPA: NADH:flavin oxidoreductase/NADH oxidase [Candidatus Eisenbacteria bacterium]|nr:NADH:flavin oxidoreductase/NADH oxidase [Candidatus Eisenbacteria bacterium]